MRSYLQAAVFVVALLVSGPALAQEAKGWIGADVQDVSKAEADKLGWDGPRGAKLKLVSPGSPADKAGLKEGDIIVAIDRTMVDTSSEVEAAIAGKSPGSEIRLQVLSGGRERRVDVTVAERPVAQSTGSAATPILMLDPGGHMALIRGLAFTPDGKHIISAGEDKVIRVWDWRAGKTVGTIRGQVGPGPEGRVFTMSLAPDGRRLAASGWMTLPGEVGDVVRIYDIPDGKLVALLKGHTNPVNGVAFSADSKRLISGESGSGNVAAIIWDLEKRTLLHRLGGHKAPIYAVGFTPDGKRAVTGSNDRTVKFWSALDGREVVTFGGHKGDIFSLAISPVDGIVASGSEDGEIRFWHGGDVRFLKVFANQNSDVGALSFSADGKLLLSSCGQRCRGRSAHVWDVPGGKEIVTYLGHGPNIVLAAAMSPDGRLAATGGGDNHEVHVWDVRTGGVEKMLAGTGSPRWATSFSSDGSQIAWGNTWRSHSSKASNPLEFKLRLPKAGQGLGVPERMTEDAASTFVRARLVHGAYALTHRIGGRFGGDAVLELKRDGQILASIERGPADGYQHRSYTFTPDGQTIVSGGDGGFLTAYDLNGRKLGDFVGHDSDITAATPSPDGRLLISGSGDQTVRLWNLKTRELIVTLYHGRDGEWVMWTPQGYYTGSPGADKIVGWQINKGPDKEADYVGADQLRDHLNRPDVVERAIILASAEQAVRELPGTAFKLADLLARPVPKFKVVSPTTGSTQRSGRASIKLAISATPNPVQLIRAHVNGRQVAHYTPPTDSGGFSAGDFFIDVPLAKGRNEVRVTLTNAIGDTAETLTLFHEGEGALDERGTLHILAIGVSDYKSLGTYCGKDGCDLKSPSADARRFAEAVEKRLGQAHKKVSPRVLANGGDAKDEPTARNIVDALDALGEAQENDTVVLFVAGHGVNEGNSYRFLPTDAEHTGGILRGSSVVRWQVLQETIESTKGRRLLFVDTCHSGNAYNQRLGNAAFHANIIAYTAARFDQEAIEDHDLGHGLFTYAVVEGLDGVGALSAKGQMSTKDLYDYVVRRVRELAVPHKREQEPQYFKGRDAEEFVLRW